MLPHGFALCSHSLCADEKASEFGPLKPLGLPLLKKRGKTVAWFERIINPRVKRSDAFGITSKDLARRTNS